MGAPTPTLSELLLHPRDEISLRLASNAYPARSVSHISATEAFITGLDNRDNAQCIVCGYDLKECLAHCHIIGKNTSGSADQWEFLKKNGYIPAHAKSHIHEARNGILMCLNHHKSFNDHLWFVRFVTIPLCAIAELGCLRFVPMRRQYVFVNISMSPQLAKFHNQPLNLDPDDVKAPFPAAFWVHEQVAWGKNFYVGPIQISHTPPHQIPMPARSAGIPIPITPVAKQPSHSLQSSTIHIRSSIPEPVWPPTATPAGSTPITASIPANSTCSSPSQLSLSSHVHKRKRKEHHDPHYTDIKPLDPWAEETKTFFGREHMLDIGFKSWFVCEAENTEDDGPEVCKRMHGLEPRDVCAWLMGTEE